MAAWWSTSSGGVLRAAASERRGNNVKGNNDFYLAGDAYVSAAEALKLATGPYKASRDAYVAASKPPSR